MKLKSTQYHIMSFSGHPMSTFQIIDPKSIDDLLPILDAENVTLQWPRPEGRVDVYHIKWYQTTNEDDFRLKEIKGITYHLYR